LKIKNFRLFTTKRKQEWEKEERAYSTFIVILPIRQNQISKPFSRILLMSNNKFYFSLEMKKWVMLSLNSITLVASN